MSDVGEQISARTKQHAEEVRAQLEELGGDFGGRYWKCGLLAVEVHEKHIWEILGYESESAFREAVHIGRSTYFRCRRLAGEIGKLLLDKGVVTRQRLNRLSLENAEHLLRLPVRKRFSESWVDKAITMTESQFEAAVDAVVLNGEEAEDTHQEKQAMIRIHCTESQKKVILMTFEEFARAQDPPLEKDAYGVIVEGLCADWHNTHQDELEAEEEAATA